MASEILGPCSRKIYEDRRLRNLDAQSTRTVPNRITAPGSGTEATLPSTLYVAPEAEASNTWSSVNEKGAFDPSPPVANPEPPGSPNGPTVPISVVSAKRVFVLEKYALSLVVPVPVIVALYFVIKLGFAGLKLMSLYLTSNGCVSHSSFGLQSAVSEVKSSPTGISEGEWLVPLVILIVQPPMLPLIVSVPLAELMSPDRDVHPAPTQAPLSAIVAVTPLTVNWSESVVVVARVVPKPIVSSEARSVIFIKILQMGLPSFVRFQRACIL